MSTMRNTFDLISLIFVIYVTLPVRLEPIPASGFPSVGDSCYTGNSRPLAGVCKLIKDCPYAISNLHAGVSPSLCGQIRNGIAVACCPVEQRISAKKCQEYSQLTRRHIQVIMPLLAPGFQRSGTGGTANDRPSGCEVLPEAYIVNGRNAKNGEFPYMVALGYGDLKEKKWSCGGTLISDEFVLTAAHCIQTTYAGPPKRIHVGDIYLENPGGTRKTLVAVAETFVHPGYKKPSTYNDIGLLRLAKKLQLSPYIQPACLPQLEHRPHQVASFEATGWGRIDNGDSQSNILQAARLQRNKTCNAVYMNKPGKDTGWPQGILKSQFCAGDKDRDTCNGDSGGPLAIKSDETCSHIVLGITSFGPRLCASGDPGVYTNVVSYLDWIEDIVWPNT